MMFATVHLSRARIVVTAITNGAGQTKDEAEGAPDVVFWFYIQ